MKLDIITEILNIPQWDQVLKNESYTEYEKSIISSYANRINSENYEMDTIGAFNFLYGHTYYYLDPITKTMVVCTGTFGKIDLGIGLPNDLDKDYILNMYERASQIWDTLGELNLQTIIQMCEFKNAEISNLDNWYSGKFKGEILPMVVSNRLTEKISELFMAKYGTDEEKKDPCMWISFCDKYRVPTIIDAFRKNYGLQAES